MNRQRKIDQDLWDDDEEKLSSDHVVERFFAQHEHDAVDAAHGKAPGPLRPRRRSARQADADE